MMSLLEISAILEYECFAEAGLNLPLLISVP